MDANTKGFRAFNVGGEKMRKVLLLGGLVLLLSGCTSGEEVTCQNNGLEEVYTLKDGIIESLTIDGEKQSSSTIDELNGTYFTSTTTNEEAKEALNNYIENNGGVCE